MRISDWSSDVCSSDLRRGVVAMSETAEKLGAHEVAAWLRLHPKFLQQFPDLAISMVVPREEGPAASLASYQLEVLRDRKSVVEGKGASSRVDLGGRRTIKKKKKIIK